MESRRLNADEQGEIGESRFPGICAEAHLICNKSTRDRAGWDFIVDFPLAPPQSVRSIDLRPPPISAHVQVKTLIQRRNAVRLRLSSAERLAREVKPAFIYVFMLCRTEFRQSILLHVIDDVLEKILKRLREEQAAGNARLINKKYVTLSTRRYGISIPPTGDAFRAAVERACGASFQDYIERKSVQVRRLGFQLRPFKGTLRFTGVRDLDELADTFLGIRREVEVDILDASETRFDIALPLKELVGRNFKISIDPEPVDNCSVVVRHDMFSFPTIFDVEVYVPLVPGLPRDAFKTLIKSKMFSMIVSASGTVNITLAEDLTMQAHPPERWVDLARLMTGLAVGKPEIEIRSKRYSEYTEFVVGEIEQTIDPIAWRGWLKLCEFASHLFRAAGVANDASVRVEDLESNGSQIFEAWALMSEMVTNLSVNLQLNEIQIKYPVRTVFVRCLLVGSVQIAYYAIVDFSLANAAGTTGWTSNKIIPGRARVINGSQAELDNFLQDAKSEAGTDISIVQYCPNGSGAIGP